MNASMGLPLIRISVVGYFEALLVITWVVTARLIARDV